MKIEGKMFDMVRFYRKYKRRRRYKAVVDKEGDIWAEEIKKKAIE
jgi:hypothetical protein